MAAVPKNRALNIFRPLTPSCATLPALGAGHLLSLGHDQDGLTLGTTYLIEQTGMALPLAALTSVMIPVAGIGGAFLSGWLIREQMNIEVPVALVRDADGAGYCGLYTVGGTHAAGTQAWWLPAGLLAATALASHGINAMLMSSLPSAWERAGRFLRSRHVRLCLYVGGGLSAILVGGLQDSLGGQYHACGYAAIVIAAWQLATLTPAC